MVEPTDLLRIGSSGVSVSALGVGCGSLAHGADPTAFFQTIAAARAAGLRHFDTAPLYLDGESERRLGEALAGIPRDRVTLSTKVGRYAAADGSRYDYSYDGTRQSVEASLRRLRVDMVDIVMIHDLDPAHHGIAYERRIDEALRGACRALHDLRREGIVRAIGVGSADGVACLRLAAVAGLDCVMLAGGHTLLRQNSLPLLEHCREHGIPVLVASPFNSGILATGAVEGARFNFAPAEPAIIEKTRRLSAICERHDAPLAAVALQYPLRHPAIAGVVSAMASAREVAANIDLMRLPIPPSLWVELQAEDLAE